ncbi:MAG: HAMP domain-containing histidine kinase [Polyangiaceae bacterium]|nr:HAMP domain-containing histidine kinase [Polyangiaceae bacterium]
MTIDRRMTWGLSLLTFVTLGLAFAAISLVLDRYQERQLDESLLDVARAEADEAPSNGFSFTTRPGPAANDVGPLEKYGLMFDEEGYPLAATPPFDTSEASLPDPHHALDVPFNFTFASRKYRGIVVAIPGYAGRRLLLAASRDDLDSDSWFVRTELAIALFVSVAWLVGAIRWLVRRNMREHRRIAEILHRIAGGDVGARVSNEVSDGDLRKVGSDVDEIAQKLAELVGHQRRFIAHAAHELRSPLAALHGEIQQALRKDRSNDEYRASLAFMQKASARLKHLADELLELARVEHVAAAPAPVPIADVMKDVVESLEPLAREKGVTVSCDAAPCEVLAEQGDVERILRNLLDNAIRHSPSDGTIQLELVVDENVRVCVRDEGDGVRFEDREAIFDPFHRAPANRVAAHGAGLGLTIARGLARKHGGDVFVGSERNCFVLSLPNHPNHPNSATHNA